MTNFSKLRILFLCISCLVAFGLVTGGCSSESEKETEESHEGHDHKEGEEHEGDDHKEGEEHEGHDHKEGEHKEGEHSDHEEEGGEIHITDEMKKTAGIAVASVERGAIDADLSTPAIVVPTETGEAHVGSLVAGRITRLYASEGTSVKKGAALAEIEAFSVAELQSDYLRAVAEVERAQAELKRNETLDEERIGARRSLEEARSAWRQAVALQKSLATQLETIGISPEEVHKGSTLTSRVVLRAPVAGIVSRRLVALGEYLEPNRDAFEIINTATVWVDAQVQPERVHVLRTGQFAKVRNNSGGNREGRIIYIAPQVDAASRTITVRIALDNRGNDFPPQSYATVEFNTSVGGSALVVPRTALEMEGGSYFVYRETPDGGFERVAVAIGATTEHQAELTAGLEEGQRIATSGVFYLKSIRKSGELAEHHH